MAAARATAIRRTMSWVSALALVVLAFFVMRLAAIGTAPVAALATDVEIADPDLHEAARPVRPGLGLEVRPRVTPIVAVVVAAPSPSRVAAVWRVSLGAVAAGPVRSGRAVVGARAPPRLG
ncbi:MAG: hypothetical protein KBG48_28040 [Kofleriaceae bacterium]|jgi:hypothetical protein|nr:hypothetical protein [Kofleriaceae bacterium]MBP9171282.1 hypothetical protein [Kofleriaceae bacterium]MBP9861574.1 hypothetical protein [Kofleriaceae bacterium]